MGEAMVRRKGRMNFEEIVRDVCFNVGYDDESKGLDANKMVVVVNVVP
jgi:S-adenosylmethionine synthetase